MSSIIEGDVLEVLRSLPREPSFDCVIADPPYNHGIWMRKPVDEYAAWCEEWLLECMARLRDRTACCTAMAGLNIWRTWPSASRSRSSAGFSGAITNG